YEGRQKQKSANIGRDRVSRDAQHLHAAQPAVHHGTAGTKRHPPERQLKSFRGERSLDQIVFADRSTAGRQKDIRAPFARSPDGGRDVLDAVASDAEVMDLGSVVAGEGGKSKSVRIDNLTRFGSGARWN